MPLGVKQRDGVPEKRMDGHLDFHGLPLVLLAAFRAEKGAQIQYYVLWSFSAYPFPLQYLQ